MNNKYQTPMMYVGNEWLLDEILQSSFDGNLEDMSGDVIFDDLTS